MKTLETERLILRPFTLDDLDDFFEYCKLETVGPNAGWKPHKDRELSKKIIEGFIEKGDVLAIYHKQDEKVIGSIGLHKKYDESLDDYYEIGYVLSTPYEGRGLMTEAVRRLLDHIFKDLKLDVVYCGHFVENNKSRRVIEKCNFNFLYEKEYESLEYGPKNSKFYSMTIKDYKKLKER